MKLIAGVDIGNSTTEVCIGAIEDNGRFRFLSSASRMTTGTKGTLPNVHGIKAALTEAMERIHEPVERLALIRLNEAAPVIGDTAMETITETIITESSMIGHNPSTPAGAGEAVGRLIFLENLWKGEAGAAYIVAVSNRFSYEEAAARLNQFLPELDIRGLILQADEAVLVENRLNCKMPIVDEVKHITRIPEGKLAAIEVALARYICQDAFQPLWDRNPSRAGCTGNKSHYSYCQKSCGKKKCSSDPHTSWKYEREYSAGRGDPFKRGERSAGEY